MEVKKSKSGVGLFATKAYSSGTMVHGLCGKCHTSPTQTTIEIGPGRHVEDTEYGIYMNHSFDPSCKILNGYIMAIGDIEKGEELTFNYNENETAMAVAFIDATTKLEVMGHGKRS